MSATKPTATAIDSPSDTKPAHPNSFTDWGHEEHDTSVPTDEGTLAMGNRTDFYVQSPETGSSHNPGSDASTSDRAGLYHRIRKHNRDNWWGYRVDVNLSAKADYEMKLKVMKALGAQLEVGKNLVYKATRQLFSIDITELGLPMGAVGFCLYAILYDEATDAYESRTQPMHWESNPGTERIYWPFREPDQNHEAFQRIAANLIDCHQNVTENSLQSVLQRIIQDGLPENSSVNQPSPQETL